MKKTLISMSIGMAGGMALATYMLADPKIKRKAENMMECAMDDIKESADCVKNSLKQK